MSERLERQWIYDGQLRPVAEMNSAGTVTATYIYGTHINIPDYIVKGTTTYRVITDHLGSLRFVINSSNGTIAQRIDYDDWGNVLVNTAPDFTPFGFAGGMYDAQTKLVRFGARDYDPEVGRWTTKDPIGFGGGFNHYSYVLLSPISFEDPFGLRVNNLDFSKCEGKKCVSRCICRLRVAHKMWESMHWGFIPIEALEYGAGIGAGAGTIGFVATGQPLWIPVGLIAGGVVGAFYGMLFDPVAKEGLRIDFMSCMNSCDCADKELTQTMFTNIWSE